MHIRSSQAGIRLTRFCCGPWVPAFAGTSGDGCWLTFACLRLCCCCRAGRCADAGRVLQGQAGQHLCRLLRRRHLRPLRPRARAPYRPAHSGQSGGRAAQHGRRRQPAARQLHLSGRAARRHRDRDHRARDRRRAAVRRHRRAIRSAPVLLARQRQRRSQHLRRLARIRASRASTISRSRNTPSAPPARPRRRCRSTRP